MNKYNLVQRDFKYVKMSLYDIELDDYSSLAIKYYSLPTWMKFDVEGGVLSTLSSSKDNIGVYRIYTSISSQVSASDFANIDNDTSSLVSSLIISGYLGYDRYITSNFDPNQPLQILTGPSNQSVEQQMHQVLTDHYFEMLTLISVESSLGIQNDSKPLQISSASQFSVKVIITLSESKHYGVSSQTVMSQDPRCRFLRDIYSALKPSFNSSYNVMTVEGPLKLIWYLRASSLI